jgi:hypothetical protein
MLPPRLDAETLSPVVVKLRLHKSVPGSDANPHRELRHPFHPFLSGRKDFIYRVVHQQTTLYRHKRTRDGVDVPNLAVLPANGETSVIAIPKLLGRG